jgi:hypothetical protein
MPPNQAFAFGRAALACQFHPEIGAESFERWLVGHAVEIASAPDRSPVSLRRDTERFARALMRLVRTAFPSAHLQRLALRPQETRSGLSAKAEGCILAHGPLINPGNESLAWSLRVEPRVDVSSDITIIERRNAVRNTELTATSLRLPLLAR